MKEIIINKLDCNQSAFKYVKKYLNNAPLSFIEKLFRKKDVKVNNHWVTKNVVLKENDVLRIYVKDEQLNDFNKKEVRVPVNFTSSIIYEDENILIINKKKGILVHEDKNEKVRTLSNEVISYLTNKKEYDSININAFTPAPCHRLDRNTSGLIVFAKNMEALQIMEELFKDKENINKYYLALVNGVVTSNGVINKPLFKDSNTGLVKVSSLGKTAISEYKVKEIYKEYTLLEVKLITGRTHQIRVHTASILHPIIGDNKYGDFKVNKLFNSKYHYDTQFLHAYKLEFKNINGKLSYLTNKSFTAPLSEKEKKILDLLKSSSN